MKLHRIENIVYIISKISFFVFIASILANFIFGDPFFITDLISGLLYGYGGVAIFVMIFIWYRRKKRGYKNPLSIEAMHTAKAELPSKIYKFCSLSTGNNKALDEMKLFSLRNKKIWMSDCSVLNDPFEGMFAFIPDEIDDNAADILKAMKEKLLHERDIFIQSSFSYEYDNILMWGHYANGCRGYCVEYEVESKEYLFPVQYLEDRILLSSPKFNQEVYDNLKQMELEFKRLKNHREHFEYMMYIQSMKSDIWSYEKEVRLISMGSAEKNSKCGNADCKMYGIKPSKIIIGYQCVYKSELINIAKELKIPVSIMEIPFHSKEYKFIEKTIKT